MPDRATMEAARPRCPLSVGGKVVPSGADWRRCGEPMRFDLGADVWICPKHGNAQTPESLVANQRAAA